MAEDCRESVNVVVQVAPNCVIDGQGQVVFFRGPEGEKIPYRCEDIYVAVSQCFEILGSLFGPVVISPSGEPEFSGADGELVGLQKIIEGFQNIITLLTVRRKIAKTEVDKAALWFKGLALRWQDVQNPFKKELRDYFVAMPSIVDKCGDPNLEAAVVAAKALVPAIRRLGELGGIIPAIWQQTTALVEIVVKAEQRLKRVYDILGSREDEVKDIISQREQIPPDALVQKLRVVAKQVAGPGANEVANALKSIPPVNPYKSVLEHYDTTCLERLDVYLSRWLAGKPRWLLTYERAFGRVRSKLKRLVLIRQSDYFQRMLILYRTRMP